jgi:hypothetical protein
VLARYQITGEIERVEVWLRGVSARTVKVFIAQRRLASGECPRFRAGAWQKALAEIAIEVANERAAHAAKRRATMRVVA